MAQRTDKGHEEQKKTTQRSSSPSFIRPDMSISPFEARSKDRKRDEVSPSMRIVLLGNSGVGKSAVGNTILGWREFRSEISCYSVTLESSGGHTTVSGRSVCVVDTPALVDTHMRPEELVREIGRIMYLSSPGAHAFLIVFRVDDRLTDQDRQILQRIELMFGEEVFKYSIILFTYGDLIEEKTVEEIIEENEALWALVDQCGGRFHVFNNRDVNNRDQVNDLLLKIDSMVEQNGGGHYSTEMIKNIHRFTREEEESLRQHNEIKRVRRETEESIGAEYEDRGFLQFLSRYKNHIYMAAAAAGLIIGRVVGGSVGLAVAAASGGFVVGAFAGATAGDGGKEKQQKEKQQKKT